MIDVILPETALMNINLYLFSTPWFHGGSLAGSGEETWIDVHCSDLDRANTLFDRLGWKWQGYTVRLRRAAR